MQYSLGPNAAIQRWDRVPRVRIQARVPALITVLLAAQVALACVPATSAADGFEQGVRCGAYIAPGAIKPPNVYPTLVPGTPYNPGTSLFTDSESEPASNFSATANWGDATTSPATVQEVEGCPEEYKVSAPSHTYLATGTYSFSYAVHDAHTGLEHTIGSEPFHVVSALPAPILGASPRVIDATVEVPWSGVVGEFDRAPSLGLVPVMTTWSIEWGDGQVSPGTASELPLGKLALSGSHTYSWPLSGAIKVSVSGGIEMGTWAIASVIVAEVPSRFHFVGQPILAAIPSVKGASAYQIIFRLNQPLPRTKSGRIRASLNSHGVASSIAAFDSRRTRACYAARSSSLAEHSAQARRRYPFALTIRGLASNTKTDGQAIVRTYPNLGSMRSGAAKQLGC